MLVNIDVVDINCPCGLSLLWWLEGGYCGPSLI
jgi:hypothetical protein